MTGTRVRAVRTSKVESELVNELLTSLAYLSEKHAGFRTEAGLQLGTKSALALESWCSRGSAAINAASGKPLAGTSLLLIDWCSPAAYDAFVKFVVIAFLQK